VLVAGNVFAYDACGGFELAALICIYRFHRALLLPSGKQSSTSGDEIILNPLLPLNFLSIHIRDHPVVF
jgi:hypothetical protein